MTDIQKLKAAAESARSAFEQLCEAGGDSLSEAWHKAEGEFDSECSAQVVLELIADFESTAYDHDLLRGEFDQLKTENEALRKDAERWRFFSVLANELQAFPHSWGLMTPEKMSFMCDQAMADAAISKEAQS